jgi:polyhydroxybutyrate depolymerase
LITAKAAWQPAAGRPSRRSEATARDRLGYNDGMAARFLALLLAAALTVFAGAPAAACGPATPCPVAGGYYHLALPPGHDGRSPLGALVFFHGHRSSAAEMMAYADLARAAHDLGFALVAPQGESESWGPRGSPGEGRRDELAFVAAILDDLARRPWLDPARLVASGFSQGGSMAWDIACHGDGRFSAFLPVAGVWWRPMPEACSAPPRPLLHIHGTADPVMPMAGRALRDRWRQGDVMAAVATMRAANRCLPQAAAETRGALACRFHAGCAGRAALALCLHDGDHHMNPAWLRAIAGWLDSALAR